MGHRSSRIKKQCQEELYYRNCLLHSMTRTLPRLDIHLVFILQRYSGSSLRLESSSRHTKLTPRLITQRGVDFAQNQTLCCPTQHRVTDQKVMEVKLELMGISETVESIKRRSNILWQSTFNQGPMKCFFLYLYCKRSSVLTITVRCQTPRWLTRHGVRLRAN